MDPDLPAADDTRDEAGRFLPGRTGNPRGRPPGSSRALRLARALAEVGIAAVVIMERPGMVQMMLRAFENDGTEPGVEAIQGLGYRLVDALDHPLSSPAERLRVVLGAPSAWPAALLLEGEAGAGKTALWTAGLELARGCRVLRARPAAA